MTNTTQPCYAFPPTTDAVVTPWYEVAASFDSRVDLPRVMAVGVVNADGELDSSWHWLFNSSIEIEMPNGTASLMHFPNERTVQLMDFPVRWRINKPQTTYPMTYALFGVGVTPSVEE